jgi:hypothetical protein
MQSSKASGALRSALKRRTQRWRRRQVFGFYLFMLTCLLVTVGGDHHGFRAFWQALFPILIATSEALSKWRRSQQRWVMNLDDRAHVEYGVNFDELPAAEQKEILGRYRMGRYPLDRIPDERQDTARLRASDTAFRILRVALLCFAAAYWTVYLWMPAGPWKEALMDSPVVISWLVVFVISLPRVVEMWTEPDEVGEPRLVANASTLT